MEKILYSPIISVETANSENLTLSCYVLNVSSHPRSGNIQILLADGQPLTTTSYSKVPMGNGTGDSISRIPFTNTNAPSVTLVYAKVTVDGNANDIRASLILTDGKGNTMVFAEMH